MAKAPAYSISLSTVIKLLAAAVGLRLAWKLGKFLYNVLTSTPPSAALQHSCIPPKDYKHTADAATKAYIHEHYPELSDLVERGNLLVLQPAAMLAQLLKQRQSAGPLAPGEAAAAQAAEAPDLTQEDIAEILSSPQLQHCLAAPVPDLLVFVGTVHVAKESGDDVTRVIQALQPSCVALELCPGRLQAMLIDPYEDPLWDLEPCPERAKQQAASKNRSLLEILEATLKSRDHNVLMSALSGMYASLEEHLNVATGVEFIAARKALIQKLQQQQAANAGATADAAADTDAAAGTSGEAASEDNSAGAAAVEAQQQAQEQQTWLDMVLPADRPVSDTLKGLWACLSPRKRLGLLCDVVWMLLWKLDEKLIQSLANEDLVDSLLQELRDEFPELLKPLLHDRNWVLSTNTWHAAQRCAGPVVSVVGKGHLPGIVYVVEQLVGWFAKTRGHPIRIMPATCSDDDEGEEQGVAAAD